MGSMEKNYHRRQSSAMAKYMSMKPRRIVRTEFRYLLTVLLVIGAYYSTRRGGSSGLGSSAGSGYGDSPSFLPAFSPRVGRSEDQDFVQRQQSPVKRSRMEHLLTSLSRRSGRSDGCTFRISSEPIPVFEDAQTIDYGNGPMSTHRPSNQFSAAACSHSAESPFTISKQRNAAPIITFITATQNPGLNFETTALNLRSQAVQNFRWVIVDDHSDDPESLERLKNVALDKRVTVIQNKGLKGLAASRNVGLNYIENDTHAAPHYVAMIDDDDLYELTATEKAVWMLESNPDWSLATFYFVMFGAENKIETNGAHSGIGNFLGGNSIANAAVIRWSAAKLCRYDSDFKLGGEDWDFWMCLASKGEWGGTLPELLFWYRKNDKAFRQARWADTFNGIDTFKQLREKIHAKHSSFHDDASSFPLVGPSTSTALEAVTWKSNLQNRVADTAPNGSILFLIPWLYMGGADIGALRMVETLSQQGYRVTVVCTMYENPAGIELRPQMMQYTHDVHVLPSFLRANDFPRYIKYLATSRAAHTVLISNSMLAYEMLPALREQLPGVSFVDYLHNEAYDGWKSGGYPTYSVIHQRYLDRSLACSYHLRDWLVERGHSSDRLGVVKLGVDLNRLIETSPGLKAAARQDLYGDKVDNSTTVLLSVARLDPQKRSTLVPLIVNELVTRHGYGCGVDSQKAKKIYMVMVGDGPLRSATERLIEQNNLQACFNLAGTQLDTSAYYKSADVFLLPSKSEGIAVAVSEAMAAGLPIVAAAAGALPEQIGVGSDHTRAGFVVQQNDRNELLEVPEYAQTLFHLLKDDKLMATFAKNGVERVRQSDWHKTLLALLPELATAKAARSRPRSEAELQQLPHPAAQLAIQTQLLEVKSFVDFAVVYNSLSVPPRKGFGRQLQLVCGDTDDTKLWLDNLEETPRSCDANETLEVDALRRSAILQCGSWCVWDLRTQDKKGWNFEGDCFRPISGDSCKEWFSSRPPTMLKD